MDRLGQILEESETSGGLKNYQLHQLCLREMYKYTFIDFLFVVPQFDFKAVKLMSTKIEILQSVVSAQQVPENLIPFVAVEKCLDEEMLSAQVLIYGRLAGSAVC